MPDEIGLIEELAANAWLAMVVQVVDGWRLRFDSGVTRRANSVLPLGRDDGTALGKPIALVEDFYGRRKAPVYYQMSPAAQPADLDAVLARRGYTIEAPTLLQTVSIDSALSALGESSTVPTEISERPIKRWFNTYAEAEGLSTGAARLREGIVRRIAPVSGFAYVRLEGQIVAVGSGVVERGWLGIFSMATLTEHRRRGAAGAVLQRLLEWGRLQGPHCAYLQVMKENAGARGLYERMGFKTRYSYHYRRRALG